MARVVQLTDSHVVRAGQTYFSVDTAAYLAEAIQGVNALRPLPEYVVVTGDLVNTGNAAEYKHFVSIMTALRVPYFATAGNHDERAAFRAGLPPAAYGGASGARVDFVVDDYPVRLIALEANTVRPWVGAVIDREQLDWLETTLATGRERPTLLAVHQPPFRTGLHYFRHLRLSRQTPLTPHYLSFAAGRTCNFRPHSLRQNVSLEERHARCDRSEHGAADRA
jgi:Icc protein